MVVGVDSFRLFIAGLRGVLGGRFDALEFVALRARHEAITRMKRQAAELGCGMVFNVRIESVRTLGGIRGESGAALEVLAYGTAILPSHAGVDDDPLRYTRGATTLPDEEPYDLLSAPAARWVLLIGGVLCLYSLGELFGWMPYWYVDTPWRVFLWLSPPLAIALYLLFRRQGMPEAESVVLGVFALVLLPFLMYFPALRLNALTDFSPPVETVYRWQGKGVYESEMPDRPVLHISRFQGYWESMPLGTRRAFVLRRGWLGFWQVEKSAFFTPLKQPVSDP